MSREESRNLTGNLRKNCAIEIFGRDVFAAATDTGAILPPGRLQPALIVRECNLGRDGRSEDSIRLLIRVFSAVGVCSDLADKAKPA